MPKTDANESGRRIADLIDRLGAVARSLGHAHGLSAAQWDALRFLARANRYSRLPSAVADYLGTTRGTVSQTLLALAHKGFVARKPDARDGRIVRLELTAAGRRLIADDPLRDIAAAALSAADAPRLAQDLLALLLSLQRRRGRKSFGVCGSCRHFRRGDAAGEAGGPHRCGLTLEPLSEPESDQICAEHTPRAA